MVLYEIFSTLNRTYVRLVEKKALVKKIASYQHGFVVQHVTQFLKNVFDKVQINYS